MSARPRGLHAAIREYSIPLIAGVFAALAWANLDGQGYEHFVELDLGFTLFGHVVTPHFLVNDVFMVFFFGVAMKEITDAMLVGGALNPIGKAINPLLGTLGGVVGPVGLYLLLTHLLVDDPAKLPAVANGWGVPTATDIALAWLVARLVFGPRHAAVSFLLLLAIADDAIGLIIIAIFYPSQLFPPAPGQLVWVAVAMAVAFGLRRARVQSWWLYVFIAGSLSFYGLIQAHLHPALALVFIVPFMPARREPGGLIAEGATDPEPSPPGTLDDYEHATKPTVDWGLFFFALLNAGVEFESVGVVTVIVVTSLLVGKTVGISLCSLLARRLGFALPDGMDTPTLVVAGVVAGMGLTVALFVCGEAFSDPELLGEAKMGALLSGAVFVLAPLVARGLGVRRQADPG